VAELNRERLSRFRRETGTLKGEVIERCQLPGTEIGLTGKGKK